MEIKERIRHIRKGMGLTQEAFARTLGVSLYTVQSWEQGLKRPSRLAVQRIQQIAPKLTEQLYGEGVRTDTEPDITTAETPQGNITATEPTPT